VTSTGEDRLRALALLRRWGWNSTGFQVLELGYSHFFDGADGCVSYVDTGGAWVVAGAPVAPPERVAEVAERFVEAARQARRRVCFFAVEERFTHATKLPALVVGEQPTWNPQRWSEKIAAHRSLREQLRRARAKGVRVRAVDASEMREPTGRSRRAIESLVRRWLGTRAMPAMVFLVDVQPFDFAEERRYFVAERGEEVVGFLCLVPVYARGGWLFEDLLRPPSAPNGTNELLVDTAMRAVAAEGSTYATLGLAPLAGPVPAWLRRARRWSAALYDFDGVRAFKAKLTPDAWDPIFLAHPRELSRYVALYDALAAFAGGTLVGFGIRTLLRGPRAVVRALAALLLPWTAVLACAGTEWFPAASVQRAWVAFDIVLALGLFALSTQWRTWLAVTLAAAISADAMLTLWEAVAFNLPNAHFVATHVVIVIACAGPALGAVTLWGAVRRHVGESRSM
jgi:phosphatidylglycerol lysyltransferase